MISFDQFARFNFSGIPWHQLAMIPVKYLIEGLPDPGTRIKTEPGFLTLADQGLLFEHSNQGQPQLVLETVATYGLLWQDSHRPYPFLIAHQPHDDQWDMHAFEITVNNLREFMYQLQLVQPDTSLATYPDFGPAYANPVQQDIDNEWQAQPPVSLFLAPGHLLVSGQPALQLDHIVQLTLRQGLMMSSGADQDMLEPATLLEIDYQLPDEPQPATLDFQFNTDELETWVTMLQTRTGLDKIEKKYLSIYPAEYQIAATITIYTKPGYLGLKNERLVFKFQDKSHADLEIALEDVAYFGTRERPGHRSALYLTVHCPIGTDWTIHTFALTADLHHDFMHHLMHIQPDAPLAPYPDYGNTLVRLLHQDIYGEWHREDNVLLYLAPDRLLAGQRTILMLDQITKITLVRAMLLNDEIQRRKLRIDFQVGDDPKPNSIAFEFMRAVDETWAQVLHTRTNAPLEVDMGRKKKADDDF